MVHRDLKSLNLLLTSPLRSNEDVPAVKVGGAVGKLEVNGGGLRRWLRYTPPENQHDIGKSPFSIGNTSSNDGCSIVIMVFGVGFAGWMQALETIFGAEKFGGNKHISVFCRVVDGNLAGEFC